MHRDQTLTLPVVAVRRATRHTTPGRRFTRGIVPHTPHTDQSICTHDRRPGTTVCLHCRHAALEVARAKRRRFLLRVASMGAIGASFLVVGVLGATVIRGKGMPHYNVIHSFSSKAVVRPASSAKPATPKPPTSTAVTQQGNVAGPPPLLPQLPTGETPFQDGITATREGDVVTVAFDTPMTRTRRPEKFEHFVRTSLPAVYGPSMDTLLAKLPVGAIASQGDLLSELPTRGVRIPVRAGWKLELYPETRAGQDGPLVVRYHASIVPDSTH
jgi:hypothetical protein